MSFQCPHCGFKAEQIDTVPEEQICSNCGKVFTAAAVPPVPGKTPVPVLKLKVKPSLTLKVPVAPSVPKPSLTLKVPVAPVAPKTTVLPTLQHSAGVDAVQDKSPAKPGLQVTVAPSPAPPSPQLAAPQPVPQSTHYIEFETNDGDETPTLSAAYLKMCKFMRITLAIIVGVTVLCGSGFAVKKLYDRINLVLHKEKRKVKQRQFFTEMLAKDENFQRYAGELGLRFEKFDEENEKDPSYFSNLSKRKILCSCAAGSYVAVEAEMQLQFLDSGIKITDKAWHQAEADVKELFGIRERINSLNVGNCLRVEGINWKESTVYRNKQHYTIFHSTGEAVFLVNGKEVTVPFKVERGAVPQFLSELPQLEKQPEVEPEESLEQKIIKSIPRRRAPALEDGTGQTE